MARYYVSGRTPAPIQGVTDPIGILWNPHSTRRVRVLEVGWGMYGDNAGFDQRRMIQRVTNKGANPELTVTPDPDNALEGDTAPPSGTVLEMGPFGTNPTLATPPLYCPHTMPTGGAVVQPAFVLPTPYGGGIVVLPGTGLCVVEGSGTGAELINNEVWFTFED